MIGKNLTKCVIILLTGIYSFTANGSPTLATKEQLGMFKNSRTCVVMEGGISFYSAAVKDAVTKYWKATGYEFIDQAEFNKRKTDAHYSFLVLMEGAFDKDPGGVSYSYISLVLGDASGDLTKMPEFCSVPLAYTGDTETDYEYVIPSVIKFMQIHLKNLEKDRLLISINGLRYYKKAGFRDKILLLNKEKMAPEAGSAEKISSVYPYNFKLLDAAEIQEQLSAPNTIFHFHVGPLEGMGAGKCYDMIFDASGNMYYYSSRKITNANPDGFNLADFREIK